MVICFSCAAATKDKLDRLLQNGGYQDYAAIISSAIDNLLVLQEHVTRSGSVILETGSRAVLPQNLGTAHAGLDSAAGSKAPYHSTSEYSGPFAPFEVEGPPSQLALAPADTASVGDGSTPDRWIFGQYNKILPLKVNCRLIARMLHSSPSGVPLQAVVEVVQQCIPELKLWLEDIDVKHGLEREASVSTGFPTKDSKSLLRYTNQFILSVNKGGTLSGFPVELGLLNRLDSKGTRLSLTEAGLQFALLSSPVLDPPRRPQERLSTDEVSFLLNHIRLAVPREHAAYRSVLRAIQDGAANPEKLDAAIHLMVPAGASISNPYLSTQRAGVVSRMSDLGLVSRQREGIRVTYSLTQKGQDYLHGE